MQLQELYITHFRSWQGVEYPQVKLTYQFAGRLPGEAPIVLVCHALTGNSSVAGPDGWWAQLIGPEKTIDTDIYTILCFDIPGNCYGGYLPDGGEQPERFSLQDVARLFLEGLEILDITSVYAIIGASLGGALVWQLAAFAPELAQNIFPIATDYKASNWLLAQTAVQMLLLQGANPIHDARIHAMLCYRTPESICARFQNGMTPDGSTPEVLDWLDYHGKTLECRFEEFAYRVMTFLTSNIRVADDVHGLNHIRSNIHLISIDSDMLFPHFQARQTAHELQTLRPDTTWDVIHSIHGHDAFLMEYAQLNAIIKPYFSHS